MSWHSALLFFGRLFEEDLPEDVLLLPLLIIILDVIIMGLVKHTVRVVITVRIFIPNASHLSLNCSLRSRPTCVRVNRHHSSGGTASLRDSAIIEATIGVALGEVLAGQE